MAKAIVIKGADFSTNALAQITFDVIHAESITLSESALSFDAIGETETLTYTVLPAGAGDPIQWISSNANVATVSNGVVSVTGVGECTITCKAGSASATCSVNVIVELDFNRYAKAYLSAGNSTNRMTTVESLYGTATATYDGNLVLCGSEDTFNHLILTKGYAALDSETNEYYLKTPDQFGSGSTRVYNQMKYPIPLVLPNNCTKIRCVAPNDNYGAYPLFYMHDTPAYPNGSETTCQSHFSPYRDLQESFNNYTFSYQASKDFNVPTGYDSVAVAFKTGTGGTNPSSMTDAQLKEFKVLCL